MRICVLIPFWVFLNKSQKKISSFYCFRTEIVRNDTCALRVSFFQLLSLFYVRLTLLPLCEYRWKPSRQTRRLFSCWRWWTQSSFLKDASETWFYSRMNHRHFQHQPENVYPLSFLFTSQFVFLYLVSVIGKQD